MIFTLLFCPRENLSIKMRSAEEMDQALSSSSSSHLYPCCVLLVTYFHLSHPSRCCHILPLSHSYVLVMVLSLSLSSLLKNSCLIPSQADVELRETILKVISKMKTTTTAEIFNLIRFGLLLLAPRSTSLFQEPRRSVVAGLLLVSVSLSSFEENMVEVVSQKEKGLD